MNQHILKGKWKEMRGILKKQWGKLTDDDLRRIEGSLDQITGIIQQRYGYTQERAEHELNHFLESYQTHMQGYSERMKAYGDQLKDYSEEVQSKVRSAVADASDKVHPAPAKKKSKGRPGLVILSGMILAALVVYFFNRQPTTGNSPSTNDYRKGL